MSVLAVSEGGFDGQEVAVVTAAGGRLAPTVLEILPLLARVIRPRVHDPRHILARSA
jgi:hypothetical protein